MTAPPLVRPARSEENDAVASLLTDAFVDEGGLNYWLRQGPEKNRARRRFFNACVRDVLHPKRKVFVAEHNGDWLGAAIWLDAGDKAFDFTTIQELKTIPFLHAIAGFNGMQKGLQLGRKLAEYHPHAPHAHLVFLGVAPLAQGRGVGSALLKQTLAPLDARGTIAYLETTTERNVALYKRHGFAVTGEFDLPDVHFWLMTREPRS